MENQTNVTVGAGIQTRLFRKEHFKTGERKVKAVLPSHLSLQVMFIIGSKDKLKVRFGLQTAQLVQIQQLLDVRQVRLQRNTWEKNNERLVWQNIINLHRDALGLCLKPWRTVWWCSWSLRFTFNLSFVTVYVILLFGLSSLFFYWPWPGSWLQSHGSYISE